MIQKFYKTEENRWYIDLPEYIESGIGTLENLEMVCGADILLDIVSKGRDKVKLEITTIEPDIYDILGYDELKLISDNNDDISGATYKLVEENNYNIKGDFQVWLCPVTLFVFNDEYPTKIWFKVL
jgi:phosphopantothenoylcysteine synthetase/decarboxylase